MATFARPPVGVAFLLAQLGSHATERFGQALVGSDLTPPLAGILRILRSDPGISQQELAVRIGLVPSRLVALVDDLEGRGWVTRARDTSDRRVNRLALTDLGGEAFAELTAIARRHEAHLTAGLDDAEARTLRALLERVAEQQGLAPGVHPGYRQAR